MLFFKSILPGVSRVLSSTSPVIILFVLSKFAKIEDLGLLNYFIALITIVGVLTDFGLPEAVQKFVIQGKDKIERISFTILSEIILVLVGGIIFLILDSITGYAISFGYSWQFFLILIFSSSNVFILIFNGLRDNLRTSLYYSLSSVLFIFITFLLYFTHTTGVINAFLFGRIISWAVFTVVPLITLFYKQLIDFSKAKFDSRFARFAVNVLISTMAYVIMGQWDSILVTKYAGNYENGIYKSVSTLATVPIILSVILQTKLLPEFSTLVHEHRMQDLKKALYKYIKLLTIFCFIIFLISIPFAQLALRVIYNDEIAINGLQYFYPILGGVLIYIISSPILSALMALGKEHLYRNVAVIQAGSFLILSMLLIGNFGITVLPFLLLFADIVFLFLNVWNLRDTLRREELTV
ncbi:MAG: oligosaccharide flippase family protein [Candidatus Dojkabacteria bacterium]